MTSQFEMCFCFTAEGQGEGSEDGQLSLEGIDDAEIDMVYI